MNSFSNDLLSMRIHREIFHTLNLIWNLYTSRISLRSLVFLSITWRNNFLQQFNNFNFSNYYIVFTTKLLKHCQAITWKVNVKFLFMSLFTNYATQSKKNILVRYILSLVHIWTKVHLSVIVSFSFPGVSLELMRGPALCITRQHICSLANIMVFFVLY